jgi:DNA-binding response OmpR family regulator
VYGGRRPRVQDGRPRRSQWQTQRVDTEDSLTSFDDGVLYIDFVQQEVMIDRKRVHLKPPEYHLLTALVLRQGEVFTPEKLMGLFEGDPSFTPDRGAYTLSCLRTKVGETLDGELIGTVRGFGVIYRSPNQ